ncbi:MAG: hypothetical protein ABIH28_03010 [archaeon]
MGEITPDKLKAEIETLSRRHGFLVHNLFADKDDYSLPEIEKLGLVRRPEILIGCQFSDEIKSRHLSLEYRLFEGEFSSFIGMITDGSFKEYPKAQQIIEKDLSEAGIRLQSNKGMIIAQLDPSMKSVETFLSTYFQSQKQVDKYISGIDQNA